MKCPDPTDSNNARVHSQTLPTIGSDSARRRARILIGSAPFVAPHRGMCQPATTSNLTVACTSGCKRTSASNEPVDLIERESSILRRSN